jgi:hypothetical protein
MDTEAAAQQAGAGQLERLPSRSMRGVGLHAWMRRAAAGAPLRYARTRSTPKVPQRKNNVTKVQDCEPFASLAGSAAHSTATTGARQGGRSAQAQGLHSGLYLEGCAAGRMASAVGALELASCSSGDSAGTLPRNTTPRLARPYQPFAFRHDLVAHQGGFSKWQCHSS